VADSHKPAREHHTRGGWWLMQHPTTLNVLIGVGAVAVLAGTVSFAVHEWDGAFARAFGLGIVAAVVLAFCGRALTARWQAVAGGAVFTLLLGSAVAGSGGLFAGTLFTTALLLAVVSVRALATGRVSG
jgi:hypothetical protein